MFEYMLVLLLTSLMIYGFFCVSVLLTEKFSYPRCVSLGISILLCMAVPHQVVLFNKLVFGAGLKASLVLLMLISSSWMVAFTKKHFGIIRGQFLEDLKCVKVHWVWFFTLGVLVFGYLGVGAAFTASSIDELAYHVPQAIGALQTDQLYAYATGLPWVVSYPQGSALMWALFAWVGKSDLFMRIPQILYLIGLLFTVASVLSGNKTSCNLIFAACLAIVSMPIVYILSTTNRADLAYAAYLVAMLAVVFPANKNGKFVPIVFTLLFFASATVKLPVISGILYGVFGLAYLTANRPKSADACEVKLTRLEKITSVFLLSFFILSFYPYVMNFLNYGNPLYPVNVSILGREVFSGPLKMDVSSGHTTFGSVQDFSRLRTWQAVLFDWYSPLNEDSYGSSGVFLAIVALPLAVFSFFMAISNIHRAHSKWIVVIVLCCALPLLIPSLVLPRYHLFFSIVLIIAAVDVLKRLEGVSSKAIVASLMIFIVPSAGIVLKNVYERYNWVNINAGFFDRGLSILTKYPMLEGMGPSPTLVNYLKDNNNGDVFYCGNMFPGLMWNSGLSNSVTYIGGYKSSCDFSKLSFMKTDDLLLCDSGLCNDVNEKVEFKYQRDMYGTTEAYRMNSHQTIIDHE